MIHKSGLTCKLIQLKSLPDSLLFEQAVKNIDLNDCPCPSCTRKGSFRKITPYRRSMISVRDGRRTEVFVSVPRVICKACGHTQSILPDILIPFSSYSVRFVITVLTEYDSKVYTVTGLCDKWQISVSTLYTWIHLFQEHAEDWFMSLSSVFRAIKDMLSQISLVCSFPLRFRMTAGFFFLQNSADRYRFPYIHESEKDFSPDSGYDKCRCTEPFDNHTCMKGEPR